MTMSEENMITLRAPLASDADALYPLLAGTSLTDTLLWDGPDSLDSYRESWRATADRVARGESHAFAVVETATETVIGFARVGLLNGFGAAVPFRGELGLWIGTQYQRRGFGSLVVRRLCEYGFKTLSLDKLEGSVFVGNEASRRIFEKNGFMLEGTIRRRVKKRGKLVDEWLFGILREDQTGQ
jgi:RimJ/RimL family protein N-acetyltransferase